MRLLAALICSALAACAPVSGRGADDNWTTGPWKRACKYDTGLLPELSGLTASVRHRGVLWAINDSGQAPVVYALDQRTCQVRGQARIVTDDYDWEAIASGRNRRGTPVLWIGDIGDNRRARQTGAVLEVPEPSLGDTTNYPVLHRFRYPNGPVDAEALMAHPDGKRLWVVSKEFSGKIYKVLPRGRTVRAKQVSSAPSFATDATYLPGTGYAIRDYSDITAYSGRIPGRRLNRLSAPAQQQAEAVAFSRDGRWLFTGSEGEPGLFRARVRK